MSAPVRTIRIPAELGRLAELRAVVRDGALAGGASQDAIDDLVQAVDEVAANIVTHGYAGAPGWIELTLAIEGRSVVVTLEDGGGHAAIDLFDRRLQGHLSNLLRSRVQGSRHGQYVAAAVAWPIV